MACTRRGPETGTAGSRWEALLREEVAQAGTQVEAETTEPWAPQSVSRPNPVAIGLRAGPARGPCLPTGSRGG